MTDRPEEHQRVPHLNDPVAIDVLVMLDRHGYRDATLHPDGTITAPPRDPAWTPPRRQSAPADVVTARVQALHAAVAELVAFGHAATQYRTVETAAGRVLDRAAEFEEWLLRDAAAPPGKVLR